MDGDGEVVIIEMVKGIERDKKNSHKMCEMMERCTPMYIVYEIIIADCSRIAAAHKMTGRAGQGRSRTISRIGRLAALWSLR